MKQRKDSDASIQAFRSETISAIPTDKIRTRTALRDWTVMDAGELAALRTSIATHGLRFPIEVFADGDRFVLLSGFRRLMAVRDLAKLDPDSHHTHINAFVRQVPDAATAFATMVEENEVRANLSHFERGRIAVIAVREGAFDNIEDAINVMFVSASKPKRSKVKSFATVFEMLGDVLRHADGLSERRGLRLAAALRQDGDARLRSALTAGQGGCVDDEWAAMEPVIIAAEAAPRVSPKIGRPRQSSSDGWQAEITRQLPGGVTLEKGRDDAEFSIRLRGASVTDARFEAVVAALWQVFEQK